MKRNYQVAQTAALNNVLLGIAQQRLSFQRMYSHLRSRLCAKYVQHNTAGGRQAISLIRCRCSRPRTRAR